MSQDNIFREVDEELRSERMRGLWRRFGPYVIGAAVGVVLVVAVNEGWSWWQGSQSAAASDKFYAALALEDGGDIAAAQASLNELIASGGGYATLSRFSQASLLAKDGKTAEAVAAYDALAASEPNTHLRELALVLAGNILVDAGDVAAVDQRVGSLVSSQSPMRNAAREALGLVNYQAGDLAAARAQFQAIVDDPLSTETLRNRIQIYLAQLIAEGEAAPVEEAPAADAAVTPGVEAPAETPAAETPATETPAVVIPDAPAAVETPAAETPAAETPTPVVEAPAAETPVVEAPAPVVETPAPAAETPMSPEPTVTETPATPEPTATTTETPAAPVVETPAVEPTPVEAAPATN